MLGEKEGVPLNQVGSERLDFWTPEFRSQQLWVQQTVQREDKDSGGKRRWRIEIGEIKTQYSSMCLVVEATKKSELLLL